MTPSLTLPLAGGGEENAARTIHTDTASTIERLHRAVLEELAAVEAMRAALKNDPQKPADADKTAHTLASLTATVNTLQRMRAGLPSTGHDDDDDLPTDLDDFREALAQRIEAFMASRGDEADAFGDAAARADKPGQ